MDVLPPDLAHYTAAHTSPESDVLRRLNRDTYVNVLRPHMLSGHLQGRVLAMISHMIRPRYVLEIGTYTGYSALCLAEGLAENGRIITIDINEEMEPFARRYWEQTPYASRIEFRAGPAAEIIPALDLVFDLVFIDADKTSYEHYYELTLDKVRPGGFLLADNVLRSGNVLQPVTDVDKDTEAIIRFNETIQNDPRVENVLLPIRDGIMLIRKK